MDPLQEDEDECMHSWVMVEALDAAVNEDIEGGDGSIYEMSGKEGIHTSGQPITQCQNASQDKCTNLQSQQGLESAQEKEQHSSETEMEYVYLTEDQQQQNEVSLSKEINHLSLQQARVEQTPTQIPQAIGMQNSEIKLILKCEPERMLNQDDESSKLQKMSNQQAVGTKQGSNSMNRSKSVAYSLLLNQAKYRENNAWESRELERLSGSHAMHVNQTSSSTPSQIQFASLIPALLPHLDKERSMQLCTLYDKLKKNEIVKDVFTRLMRDIVGDQMLRLAVNRMQSQMGSNEFQVQPQASAHQQLTVASVSFGATQVTDTHSFAQLHQDLNSPAEPAHIPSSSVKVQVGSSNPIKENSSQKSKELEQQPGSQGISSSRPSQVPYALLIPALLPHLDKEKSRKLQTLSGIMKKNEIAKDEFIRQVNDIIGGPIAQICKK